MSRRPRHFSMIRDFHLADFLTLANGACGTAAIFLAMDHVRVARVDKIYAAALLVVAALAFDVLDGRIARWRHDASPLGRELDSLADVISFGVAPACLAYAVGMTLSAGTGKVRYFEGTPIPTSTLLVVLLVVLAWLGRIGARLPLGVVDVGPVAFHPVTLLFVTSGSLMISKTLRIPKP